MNHSRNEMFESAVTRAQEKFERFLDRTGTVIACALIAYAAAIGTIIGIWG